MFKRIYSNNSLTRLSSSSQNLFSNRSLLLSSTNKTIVPRRSFVTKNALDVRKLQFQIDNGQLVEAIDYFISGYRNSGYKADVDTWCQLMRCCSIIGDRDTGTALYRHFEEQHGVNTQILLRLMHLEMRANDKQRVQELFATIKEKETPSITAYDMAIRTAPDCETVLKLCNECPHPKDARLYTAAIRNPVFEESPELLFDLWEVVVNEIATLNSSPSQTQHLYLAFVSMSSLHVSKVYDEGLLNNELLKRTVEHVCDAWQTLIDNQKNTKYEKVVDDFALARSYGLAKRMSNTSYKLKLLDLLDQYAETNAATSVFPSNALFRVQLLLFSQKLVAKKNTPATKTLMSHITEITGMNATQLRDMRKYRQKNKQPFQSLADLRDVNYPERHPVGAAQHRLDETLTSSQELAHRLTDAGDEQRAVTPPQHDGRGESPLDEYFREMGTRQDTSAWANRDIHDLLKQLPVVTTSLSIPDTHLLNSFLHLVAETMSLEDAIACFYQVFPKYGVVPREDSYNILLSKFCARGDIDSSFTLVQEMVSKNIKLTSLTFVPLMKLCRERSRVDQAPYVQKMFGLMIRLARWYDVKINLIQFNAYLSATVNFYSGWRDTSQLLDAMASLGLEPDAYTFNTLLQGVYRAKLRHGETKEDIFTLKEILTQMEKYQIKPNLITYSILLRIYHDDIKICLRFYDKLIRDGLVPNSYTLCILCNNFAQQKNGMTQENEDFIWSEMKKWRIELSNIFFNTLIKGALRAGDANKAESIIKQMQDCGFEFGQSNLLQYVEFYLSDRQPQPRVKEAVAIIEKHWDTHLSAMSLTRLMKLLRQHGQVALAQRLYTRYAAMHQDLRLHVDAPTRVDNQPIVKPRPF